MKPEGTSGEGGMLVVIAIKVKFHAGIAANVLKMPYHKLHKMRSPSEQKIMKHKFCGSRKNPAFPGS